MPFKVRATLSAGLPLAWAMGKELLPLPGVASADIWVRSEEKPGGDELAASRGVSVVLGAPARAFQNLGRGGMAPRKFLRDYPVVIRHGG